MPRRNRRPRRSAPAALVLLVLLVLLAGCGSSLSEEEVLARSGVGTAVVGAGIDDGQGVGAASDPVAGQPAPGVASGGAAADSGGSGDVSTSAPASSGGAGGGTSASSGVGAAGGGASAGKAGCTTKQAGTIRIGNVGNYSGAGAAAQASFPKGVQVWAAAVNAAGGLCGRKVEVLVQDDGGDPASYASLVRGLVEKQKVVAFVGNGALLSIQGGVEYHKKSGVPVFGNDCSTDLWFSDPVFAPTCATPHDQDVELLTIGRKLASTKKFGYLYCREAQSCAEVDADIQRGAAKEAGVEVVHRAGISISQVDFTAECQNARSAGVELFWVIADPATVSRVGQSCSRQGFRPKYLGGSVSMSPSNVKVDGLENMIVGQPVFPFTGASGPAITEYDNARKRHAPDAQPDPSYALAWAGAKLFELVATRSATTSGDITSAGLRVALLTVKGENLGGLTVPLTYTAQGPKSGPCMFAMQGDGKGSFRTPFGSAPQC
jgi:branched-chain amino acid transport system substrate-binding protein